MLFSASGTVAGVLTTPWGLWGSLGIAIAALLLLVLGIINIVLSRRT